MSTAPSPMIRIYASDGSLGRVPYEQLHDALQSFGTIAARIQAPDGTPGYIPADKVADALKAGQKNRSLKIGGREGLRISEAEGRRTVDQGSSSLTRKFDVGCEMRTYPPRSGWPVQFGIPQRQSGSRQAMTLSTSAGCGSGISRASSGRLVSMTNSEPLGRKSQWRNGSSPCVPLDVLLLLLLFFSAPDHLVECAVGRATRGRKGLLRRVEVTGDCGK